MSILKRRWKKNDFYGIIKNMTKLPLSFRRYFWDTNPRKIDIKERSSYIIERILEYGDEKAVRWLFANFAKQTIRQTLEKRRGFSEQSANYWRLILGIPKSKILCLKKQYLKRRRLTWPY